MARRRESRATRRHRDRYLSWTPGREGRPNSLRPVILTVSRFPLTISMYGTPRSPPGTSTGQVTAIFFSRRFQNHLFRWRRPFAENLNCAMMCREWLPISTWEVKLFPPSLFQSSNRGPYGRFILSARARRASPATASPITWPGLSARFLSRC